MVNRYTNRVSTNVQNGEITINLNLTITINQDGTIQVAQQQAVQQLPVRTESQIPDVPDSIYAIPEFESAEVLANFGQ